jgi:hypothetical protein
MPSAITSRLVTAATTSRRSAHFRTRSPCATGWQTASVLLATLCLTVATMTLASEPSAREEARIEYLVASVQALTGAQFIRNGKAYDAHAAAEHLRLKLRSAGARVRTAEDFIRYCASESSVSGQPYQIRFADGHLVTSAEFLREKLAEFDRRNPPAVPSASPR